MKCFMKKIIALLTLLLTATSNAQVVGTMRNGFVESTQNTCFKSQRSASVNANVSDLTLKKYCKCTAEYMADALNNELVKSIVNGEQKMPTSVISLAATYCQSNFQKY
jgi:hypothetical protein